MHWVIQDNLYREAGYADLVEAVNRYNLDHTFVKVIPFSHEMIPNVEVDGPVICMGSTSLIGIAERKGWIPGAFHNSNFSYKECLNQYGLEMLNWDAVSTRFRDVTNDGYVYSEICNFYNEFFIRPDADTKSFSGMVINIEEFIKWCDKVEALEVDSFAPTVTLDTEIIISSLKVIQQEFRLFVIDGEIITGSQYKLGDRVVSEPLIDNEVIRYARGNIERWCPDRFFAMDIALTPDGFKIIEINCGTSSGYYGSDIFKLVRALDLMMF
jgi:hypothetical protein